MPLVFASNEASASERHYDDRTGVSYEYPRQYQRRIKEGELFVYYKGIRKAGGGFQRPVYFGAGIVGAITPAPGDPSRLRCAILDYEPFAAPVPFRAEDGQPLEQGGLRKGHYQQGVRKVSDQEFVDILERAQAAKPQTTDIPKGSGSFDVNLGSLQRSASNGQGLSEIALRAAVSLLEDRFPDCAIARMPHNNFGYDLRVDRDGQAVQFVNVKGVRARRPRFSMSEGERQFADANGGQYTLFVAYDIDTATGDHQIWMQDGPVSDSVISFGVSHWACEAVVPEQ